jgi:hypothetical protein
MFLLSIYMYTAAAINGTLNPLSRKWLCPSEFGRNIYNV